MVLNNSLLSLLPSPTSNPNPIHDRRLKAEQEEEEILGNSHPCFRPNNNNNNNINNDKNNNKNKSVNKKEQQQQKQQHGHFQQQQQYYHWESEEFDEYQFVSGAVSGPIHHQSRRHSSTSSAVSSFQGYQQNQTFHHFQQQQEHYQYQYFEPFPTPTSNNDNSNIAFLAPHQIFDQPRPDMYSPPTALGVIDNAAFPPLPAENDVNPISTPTLTTMPQKRAKKTVQQVYLPPGAPGRGQQAVRGQQGQSQGSSASSTNVGPVGETSRRQDSGRRTPATTAKTQIKEDIEQAGGDWSKVDRARSGKGGQRQQQETGTGGGIGVEPVVKQKEVEYTFPEPMTSLTDSVSTRKLDYFEPTDFRAGIVEIDLVFII